MKKLIQLKDYLLEMAFLLELIRVMVLGSNVGDAMIIISLVSSIAYMKHINKSIISDKAELESRMETAVTEMNKKIDDMSNKVNSMSLNQSVRRTSLNEPQTVTAPGTPVATKRYF